MVEEEMEIEQMKMDLKKKTYEMIDTIVKCQERAVFVKLFKPTTTKFEGTLLDQFRFWNSFEIEIDKVDINSVSSLSLKSSQIRKASTYGVFFCSESRKIRTRENSVFGHFLCSGYYTKSEITNRWVNTFIHNCQPKQKDPLATPEIEKQKNLLSQESGTSQKAVRSFRMLKSVSAQ